MKTQRFRMTKGFEHGEAIEQSMTAVEPLHQTEYQFEASVGLVNLAQMVSRFKGCVWIACMPGAIFEDFASEEMALLEQGINRRHLVP